jgi:hypothetical protein
VEIRRIHHVADLVACGAPAEDVLATAQEELRRALDLRACRFEAPPYRFPLARVERNGAVTGTAEHHYGAGGMELPRHGAELPVLSRGQQIGRFVLEPTPGHGFSLEEMVVAVAIADQIGPALTSRSTSGVPTTGTGRTRH